MKCETLMILWHNTDPIYSIDFDPKNSKFCTTGSDNEVKIWGYTKNTEGHLSVEYLSSLSKHSKAVNVARFSPGGNLLASGSDDGFIVIWKLNTSTPPPSDSFMKETWSIVNILRVTTDVYDLTWSSDGLILTSVSTDNTASIWNPINKICYQIITEHTHYVQGVCWDPLGDYMITQSSDGTCRIYANEKKKKEKKEKNQQLLQQHTNTNVNSNTDSMDIDNNTSKPNKEENLVFHKMFSDERVSTRPSWSPEGSIFITPTGKFKSTPLDKFKHTSYIFSRQIKNRPLVHLPSNSPTTVVKFNPLLFKNRNTTETTLFNLPYRMIFAISTAESIIIYDTQSISRPISIVSNLHYASITDLSWSPDGTILLISSEDGFCSYLSFSIDELGEVLPESDYPESMKKSILQKQLAIQNTIVVDKVHVPVDPNSDQVSNKRKNDETNIDNENNSTVDNLNNNNNCNNNNEDNTQPEKKQKFETTTTTTTTTTSNNQDQPKPKRRIQPNLISK
eukprot:gene8010-9855_t